MAQTEACDPTPGLSLIGHTFLAVISAAGGVALLVAASGRGHDRSSGQIQVPALVLFVIVIGLILIGMGPARRNATVMVVTNKRLLIKVGIASRRTIEMLFSKIESIAVEERFFGRMLGFGTVIVHGVGGTPEDFPTIAHPIEFRRQLHQQIENAEFLQAGR